jgi:tetratricopeptide (TPR) repeat protein
MRPEIVVPQGVRALDMLLLDGHAGCAALGGAYVEAVTSGWSEFRTKDLEQAEALAQKALTLNPATTRAYQVLGDINIFRHRYDLALAQIDRALEFNPSDADNYYKRGIILVFAGRAAEALPWLEGALQFDRANSATAIGVCMAYYFLRRHAEAVDACDRGLTRNAGRITQINAHVILAVAYAALSREEDTRRERAIVARLWPLIDARAFSAQFGTEEARNYMLEGLKKAGFR